MHGPARRSLLTVLAAVLLVLVVTTAFLVNRDDRPDRAPLDAAGAGSAAATPADAAPVSVQGSDFEDGTADGWRWPAGTAASNTTAAAHGGRHSLSVGSGRAGGPSLSLVGKLRQGVQYELTAWVRLASGAPTSSMQLTVAGGVAGTIAPSTQVAVADASNAGWVRLVGTYTLATPVTSATVSVGPVSGGPAYFVDDFAIAYLPTAPAPTGILSLKTVFAKQFLVGAAIGLPQLSGAQAALLKQQFSSVTPSNVLKWAATEPEPGQFDFGAADSIVDFASANGIKVRGHTLVWYRQTPDWVFKDASGAPMTPTPQNKALLLSRMEEHITALMTRYRGKISAWDVVNEALGDDGSMRDSPWYQIAGLDYIRDAFATAHAADPAAELCINDYGLTVPAKRDAMFNLVGQLRDEGVPIDCIGDQMHVNIQAPTASQVAASIDKLAKLGVDQQITEMDMSVYTNGSTSYPTVPASVLDQQARQYKALFDVYRSRSSKISSVTVWGLSDADTWLNSTPTPRIDAPLLFDDKLHPKPAFWAVVGVAVPTTSTTPR
jgi:endo-1,4-beta-xylanase